MPGTSRRVPGGGGGVVRCGGINSHTCSVSDYAEQSHSNGIKPLNFRLALTGA